MNEILVGKIQRAALLAIWIALPLIAWAGGAVQAPQEVRWSPVTLFLCLVGWFLSWASEWGTEYIQGKRCLTNYVLAHVPRLLIGLVSALACYVMLPDLITVVGVGGKVGAFLAGLASDFIVHRIRGLIPTTPQAPPQGPTGEGGS